MVVDKALTKLGLQDAQYVGVHIRRGDKYKEVAPIPLENYVAAVKQWCDQTGTQKVFLASDDDDIHGQLQQQLGSSYQIIEQDRLLAYDYTFRGDASRKVPPPNGEEDGEKSVLVDVAALVHFTSFVMHQGIRNRSTRVAMEASSH